MNGSQASSSQEISTAKLETLYEFANALASAQDITEALDILLLSLMGITRTSSSAFFTQQDDGLYRARVRILPESPACPVPESHSVLSDVLSRFMDKVGDQYPSFTPEHLQDATWVGYRLSELLPLSGVEKQHLLELMDPIERLQQLLEVMPRFQTD